ncbi:hypothetical protein F7725_021283 [Dissostichus mawsoni]|uniref:Uncharacterized protein n=1 Tax=Dissostichus mawsoni TaxID=36200 RepID=A0A7J5YFQ8_DISMA|nr:hypothetical protein F7725_021283 [Dissostichus mawsoni]
MHSQLHFRLHAELHGHCEEGLWVTKDKFLDLLCFSLLLHLLDQEVQVDLSGEGNTLQGDPPV